jgi:hypothetical protein
MGDAVMAATACGPSVVAFVATGNGCEGGKMGFDMLDV